MKNKLKLVSENGNVCIYKDKDNKEYIFINGEFYSELITNEKKEETREYND